MDIVNSRCIDGMAGKALYKALWFMNDDKDECVSGCVVIEIEK